MFVFLSFGFSSLLLIVAFDVVSIASNWCTELLACVVLSADACSKIGWNAI